MQNVLIGGLITLAVTAMVQILIIPWVQRRTRRLERWEDDVIELAALFEEQMPMLTVRFSRPLWDWQLYRLDAVDTSRPEDVREAAAQRLPSLKDEATRAYQECWDQSVRAIQLVDRVRLVSPSAAVWDDLARLVADLHLAIVGVYVDGRLEKDGPPVPRGQLDAAQFSPVWNALDALKATLGPVRTSMRPPRSHPARRARHWVTKRFRLANDGAKHWRIPLRSKGSVPSKDVVPPA